MRCGNVSSCAPGHEEEFYIVPAFPEKHGRNVTKKLAAKMLCNQWLPAAQHSRVPPATIFLSRIWTLFCPPWRNCSRSSLRAKPVVGGPAAAATNAGVQLSSFFVYFFCGLIRRRASFGVPASANGWGMVGGPRPAQPITKRSSCPARHRTGRLSNSSTWTSPKAPYLANIRAEGSTEVFWAACQPQSGDWLRVDEAYPRQATPPPGNATSLHGPSARNPRPTQGVNALHQPP